jgi:TonB family protein
MSIARSRFLLLSLLAVGSVLHAEDVKLREEAVRLLERANRVSLPGAVPSYDQAVSFRVYYPDGTTKEGTYTKIAAGAAGYREERSFADYHDVIVRSGERMSGTVTWNPPPELRELRDQVPVHLGRFDEQDVIRSVEEADVDGRAAKCIRFDTQFGDKLQQNQICVDAARGPILRWQVGEEVIENYGYFQVGTLWEPARITRTVHGALRMQIEQKITVIEGPVDASILGPPSGHWDKLIQCQPYRRPVVISAPQPAAGNAGTETIDVVVTGFVMPSGKTDKLQLQSSPRPDLNDEALKTVAKWTFQPMICNDQPSTQWAEFVVHFQGR